MDRLKRIWKRTQLTLAFALVVFLIILVSIFLVFTGMMLLGRLGIMENLEQNRIPLMSFAFVSLIVGTVLAFTFGKLPLKPIRDVMDATDRVAEGDYSVRLDLKGPEEFKDLSQKFNHMAQELQSVEMLRSDFVGNFSHEFKTPIVSIRGFARALKWDDLTAEEREEYLDIIIAESERLSELSSNVLNLSRIEQQTILTDKTAFNLTEQIRLVIAILDGKWASKQISFQFDCSEEIICGNQELLKQVWINLLDNAVKFSPIGGIVTIEINHVNNGYEVAISNEGETLSDETMAHIFDKFYQGDLSHSTKGNGLGLAIAKRIVELHKGGIAVASTGGTIVFTTFLPK